jgi:AcrR family transcriptional regulator
MTDIDPSEVDGRTARRDRNRIAVLDAVLELFSEGDLDPAPEDVARRSGVSLRSVYRYVADKEDLARAAITRHTDKIANLFLLPNIGEGPLADRIGTFVAFRVKLYDAVAPTYRAARLRAPTSPVIAGQLGRGKEMMREQLELHFAEELDALKPNERRNVVAIADTLTQMDSLEHLRTTRGFSSRMTRDILADALARCFVRVEDP